MKSLTIEIKLLSDSLIGSGEGWGATIDADVVFDETGLPYIPAKRIKGCLRDSAKGVLNMFKKSGLNVFAIDSTSDYRDEYLLLDEFFGSPGKEDSAPLYFSNLYLKEHKTTSQWLKYLANKYSGVFSREAVLSTFTYLRQQTSINQKSGTAKEHSLRTIRVIKKGNEFTGTVDIADGANQEIALKLLYLACQNLRRIGTKRTRGFGEVECSIYENGKKLDFINELEVLCIA